MAEFFETAAGLYGDAKIVSNWVMGDMLRLVNQERVKMDELKLQPEQLWEMLKMIDAGTINGKIAKSVFELMFKTGKGPEEIVTEQGLVQISDSGQLEALAAKVIGANPKSVADYLGGKEQAFGFLVGQMMKETKGRANPRVVNQLLRKELEKRHKGQ